jgi:ribbon-helix-helix CopG family protein
MKVRLDLRFLTLHHDVLTLAGMVRTQIQLTDRQARQLRAQARERGLSLAEVIRRYVEKGLADEASDRSALYERASHLVGRFRDTRDARDVSTRHDRYLDEAFE